MSLTVTFPGRHGDLLWALPTVRALATIHGPVRLEMAPPYAGLVPLLRRQVYLEDVTVRYDWIVLQTAPMTPWMPPEVDSEPRIHLGHREWPSPDLPRAVYAGLRKYYPHVQVEELDLTTPWIGCPSPKAFLRPVVAAFTDEWFELKVGLLHLLQMRDEGQEQPPFGYIHSLTPRSGRWYAEASMHGMDWIEMARMIGTAKVLLACCSAPHVLAVAMGTPVVMMEPNPHRHNAIFYPVGKSGPQVTLVMGNDGQPTFDARAVRKALEEALCRS